MNTAKPTLGKFKMRNCPVCKSSTMRTVLDLPATPLGDRYMSSDAAAKALDFYPLTVKRCSKCSHCFLPVLTEPEESYSDYLFETRNSPGLAQAFAEITTDLYRRHNLSSSDLVLDIGANDGTWLRHFADRGAEVLAVEPAPIAASIADRRGIPVIKSYFTATAVRKSRLFRKVPKIISLNYVFANVPDPIDFLQQIADLANEQTVISIITGYHFAQLSVGMFDYVYHEHLSYFSCKDFAYLANSADLIVTHCAELPLKGGSLHIELRKAKKGLAQSPFFELLMNREEWTDQPEDKQWAETRNLISNTRTKVASAISSIRSRSTPIIGYGASHSTTTLLYTLGISDQLSAIIDDSPSKSGRYSPGSSVPVGTLEDIMRQHEDNSIIILAWQHCQRIRKRLRDVGHTGEVITPFPTFCIEVSIR